MCPMEAKLSARTSELARLESMFATREATANEKPTITRDQAPLAVTGESSAGSQK